MITAVPTAEARPIPHIREVPFIGSIRPFTRDQLPFFQRLAAKGDICGFHIGPLSMVLFNKAEYIQSILVEHSYDHFSKSRISRRFISRDGLFFSEGEAHRKRRKLMAPMFQPRHIANYVDTIVQSCEQMVSMWPDKGTIDLNQHMAALTMHIIVQVLFGIEIDKTSEALVSALITGYEHGARKTRSLMLPENWPTAYNRHIRAAKDFLENSIYQMLEERREQQSSHNTAERLDMLSVLMNTLDEDGGQMSNQQIIDECIILFGAGYETTMAALSWTWYFLCQNPAIYEKVRQEVQTTLQDRRAIPNDLAQLPLCLQVFKEAMRIYPPVPFILREALQDLTIDGYHIPKGTNLLISPYTLHRKAECFPEPDVFNPERFTLENEKQLARYAYLPFGAGPRICMGNHFVFMEGQLVIATLAQHLTFQLVPGQCIEPDPTRNLSLRPNGKLEVIVHTN